LQNVFHVPTLSIILKATPVRAVSFKRGGSWHQC